MAAAREYTDILTLADMKRELRMEQAEDTLDLLITSQIKAAGSYVNSKVFLPLLQEERTWRLDKFPGLNCPLDLKFRYVTSVGPIRYWTPDADVRSASDGVIESGALGRITPYEVATHRGFHVFWPASGWPEAQVSPAHIEVNFQVGADPVPEAIREAMILAARDYYEGQRIVDATKNSIDWTLRPWLLPENPQPSARHMRTDNGRY